MNLKITFICGATLGHIFPAINIATRIKNQSPGIDINFIIGENNNFVGFLEGFNKKFISVKPLYFRKDIVLRICLFFRSFLESFIILIKSKPNLLVSFGSYVSFPVVIIARLLNISVIIHEQNLVCGTANKILFNLADYFVISFKKTQEFLPKSKKIIYGGILVRPDLKVYSRDQASIFFKFNPSKFTILVMGGSQGSHNINEIFLASLKNISLENLQIIHLCGDKDYDFLKKEYLGLPVRFYLTRFLKNMSYAYSVSNLVIARAGAMTISELAFFNKISILIPYPWAGAHQRENAKFFIETNCLSSILEEKDLTPKKLSKTIIEAVNSGAKIDKPTELFDFNHAENFIQKIYSLSGINA